MDGQTKKIFTEMKKLKLEAMLVTSSSNISYLTGCRIDYGCVILFKKALYLLTDKRYSEMAEKRSAGNFKVITCKDSMVNTIGLLLAHEKIKNIGIEPERLRLSFYNKLKSDLPEVKLIATNNFVETARATKRREELKNIKKAVKISDQAFSFILKYIEKNFYQKITENKIAWELEKYIRDNGGENISFAMIIASGANSSIPHHLTGDRVLKKGDQIIIDFGAVVKGYRSDLTRTIFIGKPDEKQKKIYEAVLKIQKEGIKKVKPGITGQALDKYVRTEFSRAGYEDNFLHGLGHGVGLDIHELPFLNKYRLGSELKLKANMVFTIEPGLYFAGWGGVRIEDVVRMTAGGCEVLSKAAKGLEDITINV